MKSNNVTFGKKIASIVGICLATALIIIAFCGRYLGEGFAAFGNFFLGSFGMSFYGIMAAVIVACSFYLAGKSIKIPAKYVAFFAMLFVSVILFVHICTTFYLLKSNNLSYIEFATYTKYIYHYYDGNMGVPTFGGVVFGSIVYGLAAVITIWGALILVLALMVLSLIFVGDFFYSYFTGKLTLQSKSERSDVEPSEETAAVPSIETDDGIDTRQRAFEILFKDGQTYPEEVSTSPSIEPIEVAPQSEIDNPTVDKTRAEDILFGNGASQSTSTAKGFFGGVPKQEEQEDDEFVVRGYYNHTETVEPKAEESADSWKVSTPVEPARETAVNSVEPIVEEPAPVAKTKEIDIVNVTAKEEPISQPDPFEEDDSYSTALKEEVVEEEVDEPSAALQEDENEIVAIPKETVIETSGGKVIQEGLEFMTRGDLKKEQERVHKYMKYNKPPFELLNDATIMDDFESDDRQRAADAIIRKLAVFGIKIELANIIVGPSVTRYMFNVLSEKTRMSMFAQYSDDIKACVEAQEDIRIEAPVHGTNQVGIEIANKVKTPVVLRSLLESKTFHEAKGNLVFAIGQEITGKVIVADLADMPHLLIAGTTGSGKSVCLNCMIVSMMYKYGPEYVRFVMVDPKFVELSRYNGIPHMLTTETITNTNDALAGLDYLINEMEARYQLFRTNGVGNISEYNSRINPNVTQKLPYLVFIVDELADLMAVSKQAFESKLQRLAQKSRAAGIHIVLATQRPDVKTITGTIKANLPCRMALKVASQFDSNTIIGGGGAEKLLGKGDMLFMNPGSPDLERVQGAYISNDEIRALVQFSKETNEVYYDDKVSDEIFVSRRQEEEAALEQEREKDGDKESQLDPYCKRALRFWLEKNQGKASIASIQRNLGIGFNRAGRIMDSLQQLKYVETPPPSESNSKAVRVLVTLEELDDLFPDQND
ncbi:MAG: hypothetical protein J1F65_01030 [Clostridiales bacterium]|nr:hypothetical protein [Clostridiales bacterium]